MMFIGGMCVFLTLAFIAFVIVLILPHPLDLL